MDGKEPKRRKGKKDTPSKKRKRNGGRRSKTEKLRQINSDDVTVLYGLRTNSYNLEYKDKKFYRKKKAAKKSGKYFNDYYCRELRLKIREQCDKDGNQVKVTARGQRCNCVAQGQKCECKGIFFETKFDIQPPKSRVMNVVARPPLPGGPPPPLHYPVPLPARPQSTTPVTLRLNENAEFGSFFVGFPNKIVSAFERSNVLMIFSGMSLNHTESSVCVEVLGVKQTKLNEIEVYFEYPQNSGLIGDVNVRIDINVHQRRFLGDYLFSVGGISRCGKRKSIPQFAYNHTKITKMRKIVSDGDGQLIPPEILNISPLKGKTTGGDIVQISFSVFNQNIIRRLLKNVEFISSIHFGVETATILPPIRLVDNHHEWMNSSARLNCENFHEVLVSQLFVVVSTPSNEPGYVDVRMKLASIEPSLVRRNGFLYEEEESNKKKTKSIRSEKSSDVDEDAYIGMYLNEDEFGDLNQIVYPESDNVENYEIDDVDQFGANILFYCVAQGRIIDVKYLIEEKRFDARKKDSLGLTVLDIALLFDQREIYEYLTHHISNSNPRLLLATNNLSSKPPIKAKRMSSKGKERGRSFYPEKGTEEKKRRKQESESRMKKLRLEHSKIRRELIDENRRYKNEIEKLRTQRRRIIDQLQRMKMETESITKRNELERKEAILRRKNQMEQMEQVKHLHQKRFEEIRRKFYKVEDRRRIELQKTKEDLEKEKKKRNNLEMEKNEMKRYVDVLQKENQRNLEQHKKIDQLKTEILEKQFALISLSNNRLNDSRIQNYLNKHQNETEIRMNFSQHYRERFYIGFDQLIHNIIFYDSGRVKPHRDLIISRERSQLIDAYFETLVYDRNNDKIINAFLCDIEREFPKEKWNKLLQELKEHKISEEIDEEMVGLDVLLPNSVINFVHGLIKRVSDFFGGISVEINRKCDEFVQREKPKRNEMLYGEFKDKGVCRHRSVVFKIVCDIIGIQCSLQRGWTVNQQNQGAAAAWTVVKLGNLYFQVDPMNSLGLIYGVNRKYYLSLGRNLKHTEVHEEIDNIKTIERDYKISLRKKNIEPIIQGPYAISYKLKTEVKDYLLTDEDEKPEIRIIPSSVFVKEYCLSQLTSQSDVEVTKRAIRNEENRLKMLYHPNIVKYYGGFSRKEADDEIYEEREGEDKDDDVNVKDYRCIVMEYINRTGEDFLMLMKKKKERKKMKNEDVFAEVMIFFIGILNGLNYLHSLSMFHFNLRLGNILVDWNSQENYVERVKISDLGSCIEQLGHDNDDNSIPDFRKEFLAPEIEQMKKINVLDGSDGEEGIIKPEFNMKSNTYTFGIIMKEFEQFYEGYSELEKIQQKCLLISVDERPSTSEILDICLNYLRNIESKRKSEGQKKMERKVEELERMRKELKVLEKGVESEEEEEEEESEGESDGV